MIEIIGNTYAVREQLKDLGCKWNAQTKTWWAPPEKAVEVQAVLGTAVKSKSRPSGYAPRTCRDCGCKINYGALCGKCEFR
jgi:hypothetical protein